MPQGENQPEMGAKENILHKSPIYWLHLEPIKLCLCVNHLPLKSSGLGQALSKCVPQGFKTKTTLTGKPLPWNRAHCCVATWKGPGSSEATTGVFCWSVGELLSNFNDDH